jgi:hypothetical protein
VHHLIKLTRKQHPFEWGPEQKAAQQDLKITLLTLPALRPLDYNTDSPIILSVDTSYIAIGQILSQCDGENPKIRYFTHFGSITLNKCEAQFSQPKLELYSLYHAVRALKLYLIGCRNLIIEVDAQYIKGMLANPDIAPSASINRWIISILIFHFTLIHVPGSFHGPDGLSQSSFNLAINPNLKMTSTTGSTASMALCTSLIRQPSCLFTNHQLLFTSLNQMKPPSLSPMISTTLAQLSMT